MTDGSINDLQSSLRQWSGVVSHLVEGHLQIALGAALHEQGLARAGIETLVQGIGEVREIYGASHGDETEEEVNTAVSQMLTGVLEVAVGMLTHDPVLQLEGTVNLEQGISNLKMVIEQAQQWEAQQRIQSEQEQIKLLQGMTAAPEQRQNQAEQHQVRSPLQELLQETFDHLLHQEEAPSEEDHQEQEAASESESLENQQAFGVTM